VRTRRLRVLHGASRRSARAVVPDACGAGRGPRRDDRRRPRARRRAAASGAAGFPRLPRRAGRFRRAGVRDGGRRAPGAASAPERARDRGGHRRQPLPLHGLCINSASGYPLGRAFEMTTRWFGAPVQRVEDDRLLRGHGRYTDDIDEGALECCFVRSPYAHARITRIDVRAARQLAGVVAVYTAADLPFGGVDLPLLIPHPNLTHGRTQRCLASDVVRYAGEAVAFVLAESRDLAGDAAERGQVV